MEVSLLDPTDNVIQESSPVTVVRPSLSSTRRLRPYVVFASSLVGVTDH